MVQPSVITGYGRQKLSAGFLDAIVLFEKALLLRRNADLVARRTLNTAMGVRLGQRDLFQDRLFIRWFFLIHKSHSNKVLSFVNVCPYQGVVVPIHYIALHPPHRPAASFRGSPANQRLARGVQ